MVEIVYEKKKHFFADLDVGDTFTDIEGDLMMKVDSREFCHYNCVMLSSGELHTFDDNDCVDPVNCRIEVLNR